MMVEHIPLVSPLFVEKMLKATITLKSFGVGVAGTQVAIIESILTEIHELTWKD